MVSALNRHPLARRLKTKLRFGAIVPKPPSILESEGLAKHSIGKTQDRSILQGASGSLCAQKPRPPFRIHHSFMAHLLDTNHFVSHFLSKTETQTVLCLIQ